MNRYLRDNFSYLKDFINLKKEETIFTDGFLS